MSSSSSSGGRLLVTGLKHISPRNLIKQFMSSGDSLLPTDTSSRRQNWFDKAQDKYFATSDDPTYDDLPYETALIDRMGVTLSTARWMAPAAFAGNFACQLYGMTTSPNMKEIAEKHHVAFAGHPFAIAAFFSTQQVLHLLYLRRLWSGEHTIQQNEAVNYAPWYSIGNVCIGLWMVGWEFENFSLSNVFVIINSASQLYYLFARAQNLPQTDLTHLVCSTFAGIGVLDMLHNGALAFFPQVVSQPAGWVQALSAVGFAAGVATSKSLSFAASLVFNTVALTLAQSGQWQQVMGGTSVVGAAILAARLLKQ
ncbi:uncharacterized protein L969DRAFT_19805 [Mixia osmundae IAM 14324]|uniref:Uncharacterized protein n=1 Tax=Mixia osmundae (strain CBS 9802 / IAM 14324 / JCM 22182 / KY 12970) TaxID=764103 RepID=G7E271_MIXOS|nr:uncharacterized protein L969DRAFT_19805 [Mixia osmundae IAM 14324]KEI36803.1 hypothetical protein L969DRAFT_19805 [Mixia osmundae IAM 14324]GAA96931.1 hypothetical protein E5Q_03605 [Mixia osmundae IAM 14324]